jgi:prophage endopeptidase
MTNPIFYYAKIAVVLALAVMIWRNSVLSEKNEELNTKNYELSALLLDVQQSQNLIKEIDAKRTKELEDAKIKIADLERDVIDGTKRLQLAATCSKTTTSTTTSVDDAAAARLTDAAQRNYFILRDRIETAGAQIKGLQDYIRDICLK